MTFQYRHNDGSEGEGYSPFSAILAALGREAAHMKFSDLQWSTLATGIEVSDVINRTTGKKVGKLTRLAPLPITRKQS